MHERYPIPTHLPCTHVCCEVHVAEQGISNKNNSNFVIYFFSIILPVVVVFDVLTDVVIIVENDVADIVLIYVEVDAVYVAAVVTKNFKVMK